MLVSHLGVCFVANNPQFTPSVLVVQTVPAHLMGFTPIALGARLPAITELAVLQWLTFPKLLQALQQPLTKGLQQHGIAIGCVANHPAAL